MKHFAKLFFCTIIVLTACTPSTADPQEQAPFRPFESPTRQSVPGNATEQATSQVEVEDIVLDGVELLDESEEGNQGLYIFLFTHTEDQINHEYSEERYLRLAPEVASLAEAYPESGLVWTIEFQGTDARSVADRNEITGVVDLLKGYADEGWIEFGYHAHHDPTYMNRPQEELTEASSWTQRVVALDEWISCMKDPVEGGCLAAYGGGITAVQEAFGDVQIVTGLSFGDGDVGITGGAGSHSIWHYQPEMMVSFGFSDHSPASRNEDYDGLVNDLMDILSPVTDTAKGIFWMDDLLRINDSSVMNGVDALNLDQGPQSIRFTMENMDRSATRVMNAGFASKFIYAKESPTQYAYAHSDNPELPAASLNSPVEIERNYQKTSGALSFLVDSIVADEQAQFVDSQDLINLVAPEDYWQVSAAELDAIARYLLQEWGNTPPAFASDGLEYYSLRDALGLLAMGLYEADGRGNLPGSQEMMRFYGPLEAAAPGRNVIIEADAVIELADEIALMMLSAEDDWQVAPGNILPSSFETEGGRINTAQALYALASFYAYHYAGHQVEQIEIPNTAPIPDTYAILESLSCWDCYDSAWSLKPAKIH